MNKEVEEAFTIESEIRKTIHKNMGWDRIKVDLWMSTPNPLLGNSVPLEMIRKGRGRKLIRFVETSIEENFRLDRK